MALTFLGTAMDAALDWYFYGALLVRTVSPAELTWTIAALVGVIINIFGLYNANADLYFLRQAGLNGARELVAKTHRRDALVRGGVKTCFLVIGLAAMNNPPSTRPNNPATYALGLGLLAAAVALSWVDVLEYRERRRLIGILSHRRTSVDPLIDAIVGITDDSVVTNWSPGAERIFGWGTEDMLGRSLGRIMLPEDWARHRAGIERYRATGVSNRLGRPYDMVALNRVGEPIPVEITVTELDGNSRAKFMATVRQRRMLADEKDHD